LQLIIVFDTHHGTSLLHSNKENEPPSVLDCNQKSRVIDNPYVTRKKVATARPLNENQNSNLKQAPRWSASTTGPSRSLATTSKASNTAIAAIEEEEETSPIIRQILEQIGCSSRQEFWAKRAAQVNTNGSKVAPKAAPNGSKCAPNGATSGATKRTTN